MQLLETINMILGITIFVCYFYQFVFIPVALFGKRKQKNDKPKANSYAILVSARNEETVIGDLIDSIKTQDYDLAPIKIFVVADNCTDNTAAVAKEHGAIVYTRFNKEKVGKGYAIDELMQHLKTDYPAGFDAYLFFDADNILTPNYVTEINKVFSDGYEAVLGYRNGKNYGDNWISAGYSLWFLRDSRFLNYPRHIVGSSCVVAGTGFVISRSIVEELGGWPFHMLTEDTEFSAYMISSGRKIGFCRKAEFFDEQPTKFSQSWKQRLRWARGTLQVWGKYGGKLFTGMFKYGLPCFDINMSLIPAYILSVAAVFFNFTLGIVAAFVGGSVLDVAASFGQLLLNLMGIVFLMGLLTTITEWKHIHTSTAKKILYLFTFPFFMATYIPVAIAALFYKPKWTPIAHTVTRESLEKSKSTSLTGTGGSEKTDAPKKEKKQVVFETQ